MFSIFCCVYEAIVKKKKALLYNYIDNNQIPKHVISTTQILWHHAFDYTTQ